MYKWLFNIIFCCFTLSAFAQKGSGNENYWQQKVQYKINAKVDEKKLTVGGDLELIYTNNSPDTLYEVFFHLYQNAFQNASYYHNLQVANSLKPKYGLYEKSGLGTAVSKVESSKGVDTLIFDNTLLKVQLKTAILPHESCRITIDFTSYWGSGSSRRRMKAYYVEGRNVHFNGAHWYPRVAVYDHKFGWNTNQHLDKEFYGEFGTFDVALDFANDYVVEATGRLLNEEQVLPAELKARLALKNFLHRGKGGAGDTLSVPIKRVAGERKVWKFRAENVHDFVFTADPTYRIDEVKWNGIKAIAVVEEQHCSKWTTAAQFAMDVIKVYSEDFGMYPYPKMVVADARDGMEYPMVTLNTGVEPRFKGLFAHEIAHNWFYGMVGSNETYRAFMDEGFTQFLTIWSLRKLDGEIYTPYAKPSENWYVRQFQKGPKSADLRAYWSYYSSSIKNDETTLNTHSSDFNGGSLRHGGGYGQVYTKTAVMLYNLQYVLGDELFLAAMKNYVREWKFKHPYPEDFRKSIIRFTKVDLNWFFDQWIETNKTIDYKVGRVKKLNGDTFEITFKRLGEMQMPIDFEVKNFNDSALNFHIPNTWFVKSTKAKVLPKWYGWGKLNATYTAKIVVPGGVATVNIDPSQRLADINPLNNSNKFPLLIEYDGKTAQFPNRENYVLKIHPDVWWNAFDGVKLGAKFSGDYMNLKHQIDGGLWMNTGLVQGELGNDVAVNGFDKISYAFKYENLLAKIWRDLKVNASVSQLGGLHRLSAGLTKRSASGQHLFGLYSLSLFRSSVNQLNYALNPEFWNLRQANNSINAVYNNKHRVAGGRGVLDVNFRTSALLSSYDYEYLNVEYKYEKRVNKLKYRSRFFAFVGFGDNWAPESRLFLAGGNPEEQMDNKYTRAAGIFSHDLAGFGDVIGGFHFGGGLNLRGYSGYFTPELSTTEGVVLTHTGTQGAAINFEVEFDEYLGLNTWRGLSKFVTLNSYVFGDAGLINIESEKNLTFTDPRMDAGVGLSATLKRFYRLTQIKPVTFRADFPIFINRPPALTPDYWAFRMVLGVKRAF